MTGPFEAMVERVFDKLPDNIGWGRIRDVLLNPTDDEMRRFASGRGYISHDGVVYFWEYGLATHEMIEQFTKDRMRVAFYTSYKPGKPGPNAGLRIHVSDYSTTMAGKAAVEAITSNKYIQAAAPDMVTEYEVDWGKTTSPSQKTFKRWDDDQKKFVNVDANGNVLPESIQESGVADTILHQLGGSRFITMTGAKSFVGDDKMLMFSLPANFAKGGVNKVRITLQPDDLYTIEFFKIRGTNVKPIAKHEDVSVDRLRAVFADETGLRTSL